MLFLKCFSLLYNSHRPQQCHFEVSSNKVSVLLANIVVIILGSQCVSSVILLREPLGQKYSSPRQCTFEIDSARPGFFYHGSPLFTRVIKSQKLRFLISSI